MKRAQGKDKQLRDLLEICHIAEGVSTRIHGLMEKAEIYRVVKEEFEHSKRYTVSILLLTENGSELEVAESSIPSSRLEAGEKAAGLRMKDYKIDLKRSSFFNQVIREGEIVQGSTSDILDELFRPEIAHLVSKTVGYRKRITILIPLMSWGKVIGTLAVACTDLAEYLIPPMENLARHISAALTLADEDAKRKQAEVELRTTRERYDQIIESMHEGIWVADKDGYTTFVNARISEMLGYTTDEMAGRHLFSFVDEHNMAIASRALERRKQGITEQHELELLRKDGTSVYMLMASAPLSDDEGSYAGSVSGVLDISERKRTEQLLQESERHYRLLADNVTDIIFTMDMNLRYTYVSPSVTRLSGYSVGEAMGHTLQEVLTPASLKVAMDAFAEEEVLEDMEEKSLTRSRTLRLEMYRKDGSTFWAEVRVTALRDQDGQPVGFVGIARDISEHIQAEESLK